MRKLFLAVLIVTLSAPVFGGNVSSKIKKVTVFQQGAQVFRTATKSLKKGRSQVTFSGLTTSIDANSIQVKGKGKFTIMAVYHQINYLKKQELTRRLKEMQDSVLLLQNEMNLDNRLMKAYQDESNMLLANKSIGGTNTGVDINSLKAMADFYRIRLKDIYTRTFNIEQGMIAKKQKIQVLRNQINQTRRGYQNSVSEIIVDLDVKETTQAQFDLSYLVHSASWSPQYDIRAKDVHSPIELHYRAMIRQSTGVDWKNVKLSVSTGNPRNNSVIPQMNIWYLNYYLNNRNYTMRKQKVGAYDAQKRETRTDDVEELDMAYTTVKSPLVNANNSSNYTTVNVSQTNIQFEISLPYTIPSTNKLINVKVQKNELKADYRYYCIPKLSLDAFLQARITGWEELNLLPGSVNIFFDGTFVGKSQIDPQLLSDTLDVSLGKDQSIVLKRTKVKDKTGKIVMGGNKKMNVGWEISVRNGKSQAIDITIKDQIPLSRKKEIEIALNGKSGAKYDVETGFLQWDLKMKPKTTEQIRFDYQIKYPKEYNLANQW